MVPPLRRGDEGNHKGSFCLNQDFQDARMVRMDSRPVSGDGTCLRGNDGFATHSCWGNDETGGHE